MYMLYTQKLETWSSSFAATCPTNSKQTKLWLVVIPDGLPA